MNWSDKLKGVAHEVDKHRIAKPKRTFGDLNDNKKRPRLVKEANGDRPATGWTNDKDLKGTPHDKPAPFRARVTGWQFKKSTTAVISPKDKKPPFKSTKDRGEFGDAGNANKRGGRKGIDVVKEGAIAQAAANAAVRMTMAYLLRQGGRDSAVKNADKKRKRPVKEENDNAGQPNKLSRAQKFSAITTKFTVLNPHLNDTSTARRNSRKPWNVANDRKKAALRENEVAANCVGGGQVAGLNGDPPVRKKKKKMGGIFRR